MISRPTAVPQLVATAMVAIALLAACAAVQLPSPTPPDMETIDGMGHGTQEHAMETPDANAGTGLLSFATMDFTGASDCAWCHTGLLDQSGADVSIDTAWRATMMANSARDPFWQAKVEAEASALPEQSRQIQELCAKCHMPMASTQASVDGSDRSVLAPGFLAADHTLHLPAMDGVSCSLCHQITDQHLGEPAGFSGAYVIDTSTSPPDRLSYGPFPQPLAMPMQEHVGFTPVEGSHTEEAGLCAICHTVFTPHVDSEGKLTGSFPEQTPYLEWAHSSFGKDGETASSCQSCHMPEAQGSVVVSNRPRNGRLPARTPFATHDFTGGNTMMVALIQSQAAETAGSPSSLAYESVLQRTQVKLESQTASLSLERRIEGDQLLVDVQISTFAGHKVPSGFPARRVWLHLIATDGSGAVLFESGAPQPDGIIAGNDADASASTYEPHYEILTQPDQVQIYEAIMQDSSGAPTYSLVQAASYIKDNRLLPSGFGKDDAPADIAVRGAAQADTSFLGGGDRITYVLPLSEHPGTISVTVELLYQSIGHRFAAELFNTQTPLVTQFSSAYAAAPKVAVVLASAQTVVDR